MWKCKHIFMNYCLLIFHPQMFLIIFSEGQYLFRPVVIRSNLFRPIQTDSDKIIWKLKRYIFWENCHLFHQKNYIKYWRIIVCHSFFRDIVLFFTYWKRGYCTVSIQYWRKKNTWGEIENWLAARYLKKEDFV